MDGTVDEFHRRSISVAKRRGLVSVDDMSHGANIVMSLLMAFGMMFASNVGAPPFSLSHALQHIVFMMRLRVCAFEAAIHLMYNMTNMIHVIILVLMRNGLSVRLYHVLTVLQKALVYFVTMTHFTYVVWFVTIAGISMSHMNLVFHVVCWWALVWKDSWSDDLVASERVYCRLLKAYNA